MKTPSYVIVHAGTLAHLQSVVNEGIAEGYAPVGGPFNASAFNPPHNTIAQAMVLSATYAISAVKTPEKLTAKSTKNTERKP